MAWRDLQTLTSWKEAQATILDRREVVNTSSDNRPGQQRRTSSTRTPEFALKYQAGELEIISTGFVAGWSVHIGGQVTGKGDMNDWVPGKTIPCWYDPADPGHVVVRRGWGGASLFFGLFPLPILWFGLRLLRKLNDAVRWLEESEVLSAFSQRSLSVLSAFSQRSLSVRSRLIGSGSVHTKIKNPKVTFPTERHPARRGGSSVCALPENRTLRAEADSISQ